MEKCKKSFVLYADILEVANELTDEQAGILFKAILSFVNGIEPVVPNEMKILWIVIKQQLERDSIKYTERCKKNAENQKKRWEKIKALQNNATNEYERIQTNTNVYDSIQTNTNGTDNDSDTDTETDNENENDNENETDIKEKIHKKEKSEKSSTKDSTDSVLFDEFWKLYPKKVAKDKCKTAFNRIAGLKKIYPTIILALKRDIASTQWLKDSGQFIPNPLTWINQKRWESTMDQPQNPQYSLYGDINQGWEEV